MNKKPLILNFQVKLQEPPDKPAYEYDNTQHLNVIEFEGQKFPFINLEQSVVELDTKTRGNK